MGRDERATCPQSRAACQVIWNRLLATECDAFALYVACLLDCDREHRDIRASIIWWADS